MKAIVLGAGPGGTAVASLLRREAFEVTIVEREVNAGVAPSFSSADVRRFFTDAARAFPRQAPRLFRLFTFIRAMSEAEAARWDEHPLDELLRGFLDDARAIDRLGGKLASMFLLTSNEASAGETIARLRARDRAPIDLVLGDVDERRARTIVVEDRRARGVLLDDGAVLASEIVVSTLSLERTVLELAGLEAFPAAYVDRVKSIRSVTDEAGFTISTAQTFDQAGRRRPVVQTPVRGLYVAGFAAGGRGVGVDLVASSARECVDRVLVDLGRELVAPSPPTPVDLAKAIASRALTAPIAWLARRA